MSQSCVKTHNSKKKLERISQLGIIKTLINLIFIFIF